MIILLVKLIAAHLIGDFMLQSNMMCRLKYDNDWSKRIAALSVHSAIQAILSYVFIAWWSNWIIPVVIFISHFMIDLVKVSYGSRKLPSLIADQVAHYMVIILLGWFVSVNDGSCGQPGLFSISFWIVGTAYIAVLAPTSMLIKSFVEYERWMPEDDSLQGLPNAGKWIGYLERILILTFIFTENVEGIGFLLAAKSVFRFGELSKARDIKITEYVLIGTFASFTIAILVGFAARWLNTFGKEALAFY